MDEAGPSFRANEIVRHLIASPAGNHSFGSHRITDQLEGDAQWMTSGTDTTGRVQNFAQGNHFKNGHDFLPAVISEVTQQFRLIDRRRSISSLATEVGAPLEAKVNTRASGGGSWARSTSRESPILTPPGVRTGPVSDCHFSQACCKLFKL